MNLPSITQEGDASQPWRSSIALRWDQCRFGANPQLFIIHAANFRPQDRIGAILINVTEQTIKNAKDQGPPTYSDHS